MDGVDGSAPPRSLVLPARPLTRALDWLRGTPTGLAVLAVAVGAGAGAGAVAFRYLILGFTLLFSGHRDYSAAGRAADGLAHGIGPWFVLVVPVLGGLLYGPLIHRFAREARGHGVPEVMLAVAERGGRIRPQVALVKSLASALTIGSGGSVGREGPIVQIGSALGSTLGQAARVPESRLRILVACGAAGGISATFNAPIAGVFFALELILRDFEVASFGVVVLASIAASSVGRAAFGDHAFLHLPTFVLRSPLEYPLYAGLGLAAALVGVAFIRVLYGSEDVADRLWRGPEWLRPAVGGLALGLVLLALPELYGVGYPPLERAIAGHYTIALLLLLLAGKIAATSITIAIGGSGGVFAPSLFMGAMLGSAYGAAVHRLLPHVASSAGAYGLLGMGAVFAAAARAPITAVIIVFELTGEYSVILPLMFAIVVATGVSSLLSADTIYTLKLRRRGVEILRGRAADFMQLLHVDDAMQPLPEALPRELPLAELIERLTNADRDALPVVDGDGRYRGTVTAAQVEEAMRDNALDARAGDLAQETPALHADQTLQEALGVLVHGPRSGLPVVDAAGGRVVGWVSHLDLLRAYSERLERSLARAAPTAPARASTGAASALGRLRDYRIVDLELCHEHADRRVGDLRFPPSTAVVAIRRDGTSMEPAPQTRLRSGDRLTVLAPSQHVDKLADLLAPSRRREAAAGGRIAGDE